MEQPGRNALIGLMVSLDERVVASPVNGAAGRNALIG